MYQYGIQKRDKSSFFYFSLQLIKQLDSKVQELNGSLICRKQNHNEPIIMIATDESMPVLERLFVKNVQNQTRFDMIKEKLNKLDHENTKERYKDLQIIKLKEQQVDNQNMPLDTPLKKSEIQLINVTKQSDYSVSITFSRDGQIMVAGCEENVIILKFDKVQMTEKQKFIGYSLSVYCLVFSQKFNWFAWGNRDSQIIFWKQQYSY